MGNNFTTPTSSLSSSLASSSDNQAFIPPSRDETESNQDSPSVQTDFIVSNSPSKTLNDSLSNNGKSINETFHTPDDDDQDFSLSLLGSFLNPFKSLTLSTLTSWLGPISSTAMIIGCVMPYVPQYVTILKTRSCSGFSTFVCLTLLVSNILRIAFWFGHRFELPLLIQSIIMVLAQLVLLEICVRVKRSPVKQTIWTSHPRYFWRWTNLASYLEFMILFTLMLISTVYLFIDCTPFIESLGYCALVSESMLGLPQVIRNFRKKSVEGMSLSMVLMWLAGDTFKTGYFVANAVPYQFWLCGLLQISIDIVILFQVCLYRPDSSSKLDTKVDESPKEMMAL